MTTAFEKKNSTIYFAFATFFFNYPKTIHV